MQEIGEIDMRRAMKMTWRCNSQKQKYATKKHVNKRVPATDASKNMPGN